MTFLRGDEHELVHLSIVPFVVFPTCKITALDVFFQISNAVDVSKGARRVQRVAANWKAHLCKCFNTFKAGTKIQPSLVLTSICLRSTAALTAFSLISFFEAPFASPQLMTRIGWRLSSALIENFLIPIDHVRETLLHLDDMFLEICEFVVFSVSDRFDEFKPFLVSYLPFQIALAGCAVVSIADDLPSVIPEAFNALSSFIRSAHGIHVAELLNCAPLSTFVRLQRLQNRTPGIFSQPSSRRVR